MDGESDVVGRATQLMDDRRDRRDRLVWMVAREAIEICAFGANYFEFVICDCSAQRQNCDPQQT